MKILVLDSALARSCAAVVVDDRVIAELHATNEQAPPSRGQAGMLPRMAAEVLARSGNDAHALDLVAVTVGPGSFTGIRASLALAHGLALGAGIPVIGITIGEALAFSLPHLGQRQLWAVTDNRRGRVFLERGCTVSSAATELLPPCGGPVAVAGDSAPRVAAALAARGEDVMLTDARQPQPRHIAQAATLRQQGALPPREARPLYVDPPEARPPANGLRTPPR